MRVVKTKGLISFTVTAKLICAFVFAYAECWFSHEVALILKVLVENLEKKYHNAGDMLDIL